MSLQLNFMRDVAARCLDQLTAAGYAVTPADDEEAIYAYVRVRHRRVRSRPRTVHKAAYEIPPHLAEGEKQLLNKVVAGDDLWPHQSRKIVNESDEDGMLNDYGIQHFHLGTTPDPRRPHLIAGTKELLFAVVKDNDFYAIGIYDHSAWTKKVIVDTVHATWPVLTHDYTLRGVIGLRHNYTDEEAKKLRAAGINVLQQRPDGSVQMGMGGGISAAGTSVKTRRETDQLIVHTQDVQTAVAKTLAEKVAAGALPAGTAVRVIWEDSQIFAVTEPPAFKVDLTDRLVIPPL